MRQLLIALTAASGLLATHALAADKPAFGPAPAWVKPVGLPPPAAKPGDAPVAVLLSDQQLDMEPGRQTSYSDLAFKIQTPEGLAAGNISFAWRPDVDEPTVHKLLIHRGDQTIDVLASGQTFTVVRREPNLESATLDGVLTANIQPEGLQVGDIVEFVISIRSSDPVMEGHVEGLAATWNGVPIDKAHMRIQWPAGLNLRFRQTGGLPALTPARAPGGSAVELSLDGVQPIIPPNGAPTRYAIGRLVEVSDYGSWASVGALMAPLFEKASVLPAQGPLRTEVEKIRALSPDPRLRAQAALQLVQAKVRYVALVMGQGGLVPADAETTWARRFGDCKAKTALLLAILHELGIQAEPVAVNSVAGDGIDARLPMIGLFDHVLVRATIAGRTYWLDGARQGDASLDRLVTPDYGWGLPLVATGAALVRMIPPPAASPTKTLAIRLDASGGILAPAPARVELTLADDAAQVMNLALSSLAGEARDHALRDYWHDQYDFIDAKSVSASFEAKTGEEHLTMEGVAHMDWSSGWYQTDGMEVGYKPDFHRDPGPGQDAPFAVNYPYFARTTETIILPPGFHLSAAAVKADVDQTLAGIEYHRHARVDGDTVVLEKTERSLVPEISVKDAQADQKPLRDLAGKLLYIAKPTDYAATDQDVQASLTTTPTDAQGFLTRGATLLARGRYDEAIADFDHLTALDPKNAFGPANRAVARFWKHDLPGAEKDLQAALALDPKNLVALHAKGLIEEQKANRSAALAAYTEALAVSPTDSFALGRRAVLRYQSGDLEGALTDSAQALASNPRGLEAHLTRLNIFYGQGKAAEALAEAEAIAADKKNTFAQVTAANTFAHFGKSDAAMAAYAQALANKPEAYIYLNRAQNRPQSDLPARRADLDAALALDPAFAPAIQAKASLLADQGDTAGAIGLYTSALAKTPADADLLLGRGIAYAKAGDAARAEADFVAARAKVTTAGGLNNLCWSKATAGVALASALADCDASLAKAPDTVATLDSRAFVLLRMGRVDEAIAGYDAALAKRPGQAASLYGRGVAWSRKGDKAHADADFALALKSDPKVRDQFDRYGVKP